MRRPFDAAAPGGDAAGLVVNARGDGNRYRLRVYTRDPATGHENGFAYAAVFETRAGEVTRAELRWPQFAASFRGRPVAEAPPIRFADIVGIGVMITKADHRDGRGPFALDLLRIEPLR
jgi:NADH dehydrogenase [ubiquinone] 1 alpha subcomplex assembly factor 1